jgi:hypothetical protein
MRPRPYLVRSFSTRTTDLASPRHSLSAEPSPDSGRRRSALRLVKQTESQRPRKATKQDTSRLSAIQYCGTPALTTFINDPLQQGSLDTTRVGIRQVNLYSGCGVRPARSGDQDRGDPKPSAQTAQKTDTARPVSTLSCFPPLTLLSILSARTRPASTSPSPSPVPPWPSSVGRTGSTPRPLGRVLRAAHPVPVGELDAPAVVTAYKNLKYVDRDFRHIKSDDPDLRAGLPPSRGTRQGARADPHARLLPDLASAPGLGPADLHRPGPARPENPVAPARRSAAAQAEASCQHDPAGQPDHGFRGLRDHLATLTRNQARFNGTTATVRCSPSRPARMLAAALPRSARYARPTCARGGRWRDRLRHNN